MKKSIKELEKIVQTARKEMYALEEKEWKEKEEPLYWQAVDLVYGHSTLHKKNGEFYMAKLLKYKGDRDFDIVEMEIYKREGEVQSYSIHRKTEHFYHAEQIGKYHTIFPDRTFKKYYDLIRSMTLV